MNFHVAVPWIGAIGLSAWLSSRAWQPEPPYSPENAAVALPRPASPEERALLEQQAEQLSAWVSQARIETGAPIPVAEVEAHLPQPIFDNPLVDGVGGIQESCPIEALSQPGLDWIYCPDDGRFRANLADVTASEAQSPR